MRIEVVCAEPGSQRIVELELGDGATVGEAVAAAIERGNIPPVDLAQTRCGVFGKLADAATLLSDGDRVEIYRPLTVSAHDARLRRAKKRKGAGKRA